MKRDSASSISNEVIDAIKSGKVQMRPKIYYTLLGVLTGAAIVLSTIATSYFFSIIFFWLRIESAGTNAFGARLRLAEAVESFPWWSLILSIVLFIGAVLLVRSQGKMYKYKTTTVGLILVIVLIIAGIGMMSVGVGRNHTPYRTGDGSRGLEFRQGR